MLPDIVTSMEKSAYINVYFIYNRLSVTSDYDYILAMLLGSNKNSKVEVTSFLSTYHIWCSQCNPEGCKAQPVQTDSTRQS